MYYFRTSVQYNVVQILPEVLPKYHNSVLPTPLFGGKYFRTSVLPYTYSTVHVYEGTSGNNSIIVSKFRSICMFSTPRERELTSDFRQVDKVVLAPPRCLAASRRNMIEGLEAYKTKFDKWLNAQPPAVRAQFRVSTKY